MITDKELLELAAKAAGLTNLVYCPAWKCMAEYVEHDGGFYKWETYWNPLRYDGDALHLVAILGLDITHGSTPTGAKVVMVSCEEKFSGRFVKSIEQDPLEATRRAIVRAAAEIGKAMP